MLTSFGNWAVIDIETTGFNADTSFLVAIGILCEDEEKIFFTERTADEKKILHQFLNFLESKGISTLIGYNIKNFDIPYLAGKLLMYGLNPREIDKYILVDLYEYIRKVKFESRSLSNICNVAMEFNRDYEDEFPPVLYIKYLDTREQEFKDRIIGHLKEDLVSTRILAKKLGII